jgi:hypothetical protein
MDSGLLNVSGVNTLKLVVTDPSSADYAGFAEATLSKP